MTKKGIFAFLFCTMVSETIPIIMMSCLPDYQAFTLRWRGKKSGDGDFSLYLVHKYTELLDHMAFKYLFVDLQNK